MDLRQKYSRDLIIRDKTNVEGGFVDNPDDLGGVTNHGITQRVAMMHQKVLTKRFGWDGLMKNLTEEMAFYIYVVDYWDKMYLNDIWAIHPLLADKMFDFGINAGVNRSTELLQRFLTLNNDKGRLYDDLLVDGWIGPVTLRALKSYLRVRTGKEGVFNLLFGFLCQQGDYYLDISEAREKNETFTYGWVRRAAEDAIEYVYALDMAE